MSLCVHPKNTSTVIIYNEKLLVEHISGCGEFDGEEDICIKRISAVTFGNEEQVRLEKLNKML